MPCMLCVCVDRSATLVPPTQRNCDGSHLVDEAARAARGLAVWQACSRVHASWVHSRNLAVAALHGSQLSKGGALGLPWVRLVRLTWVQAGHRAAKAPRLPAGVEGGATDLCLKQGPGLASNRFQKDKLPTAPYLRGDVREVWLWIAASLTHA